MKRHPRYKHDCDKCEFQDCYASGDWYVCPPEGGTGSVIKRMSDEGSDYWSMPIDMIDGMHCDFIKSATTGKYIANTDLVIARAVLAAWRLNTSEEMVAERPSRKSPGSEQTTRMAKQPKEVIRDKVKAYDGEFSPKNHLPEHAFNDGIIIPKADRKPMTRKATLAGPDMYNLSPKSDLIREIANIKGTPVIDIKLKGVEVSKEMHEALQRVDTSENISHETMNDFVKALQPQQVVEALNDPLKLRLVVDESETEDFLGFPVHWLV